MDWRGNPIQMKSTFTIIMAVVMFPAWGSFDATRCDDQPVMMNALINTFIEERGKSVIFW